MIDERLHWAAGNTHLVQLGDVVDRGPDSRKALDLLRRLETEASHAGGQVHALLGTSASVTAVTRGAGAALGRGRGVCFDL